MSTMTQLTQTDEVISRLMTDLQAGSADATALLNHLKTPATYDLPVLFTALTADTEVKAAFSGLQELLPASTYTKRAWHRYHLNADNAALELTSVMYPALTALNDGKMSRADLLVFSNMDDREYTAVTAAELAGNGTYFNVMQDGVYRISASFCLRFYPKAQGNVTADFSDQTVTLAAPSFKTTPVDVIATVTSDGLLGLGASPRSYHRLAEGRMSQGDLMGGRKRSLGGSIELRLVAGDRVSLIFERGSRLGTYSKTVGGVTTVTEEAIGFAKVVGPYFYSNTSRDEQNWVEVTRIS